MDKRDIRTEPSSTPSTAWASGNLQEGANGVSRCKITKETLGLREIGKKRISRMLLKACWGVRHHLGTVGVRNSIRYGGWSHVENGGVQLTQLSRILAKTGQCRDQHRNPKLEASLES